MATTAELLERCLSFLTLVPKESVAESAASKALSEAFSAVVEDSAASAPSSPREPETPPLVVKTEYIDITEWLQAKTAEFPDGRMVRPDSLRLLEAMNSIEIMDAKMDNGLQEASGHIMLAKEAIELGWVPADTTLSTASVVELWDRLVRALATFLTGKGTIMESVMCCHYVCELKSSVIRTPQMFAFCALVLKIASHARKLIMSSSIGQEEDFQHPDLGFKYANNLPDEDLLSLLDSVQLDLVEKIRSESSSSSSASSLDPLEKLQTQLLSEYIKLLRVLYSLVVICQTNTFKIAEVLALIKAGQVAVKEKTAMEDKVQEAAEKLAVEERNQREDTVNKQVEAIWEQLVLRRLVTHVGMRSPEIISTQESTLFFQSIFDQIITIQQLDPKTHTLDHCFEFVLKFSTRIPSILSRSIMMRFLTMDDKILGQTHASAAKTALQRFGVSDRVLQSEKTVLLLENISKTFLTVIRMLFHNRARQHRLSSFVFQELNLLMQHTRTIDFSIFQQPVLYADLPEPVVHPINLSTWVLNIITQLMTHFFELGFELELYRPDDLMMVYWYYDYVLQRRHLVTTFAKRNKKQANSRAATKKSKIKKPLKVQEVEPSPEMLFGLACQALTRAYLRHLAALSLLTGETPDTLALGSKRLSNVEMRFNHRFQSFHMLEYPAPLFYNHFKQATDLTNRNLNVKDLFSYATDRYKEAEGFLAKILTFAKVDQSVKDAIPNIKRICVTNAVQISLLQRKTPEQQKAVRPQFDYSLHNQFPIVKIL